MQGKMIWQPQAQDPFEGGDLEEKGQAEGDSKAAAVPSRSSSSPTACALRPLFLALFLVLTTSSGVRDSVWNRPCWFDMEPRSADVVELV